MQNPNTRPIYATATGEGGDGTRGQRMAFDISAITDWAAVGAVARERRDIGVIEYCRVVAGNSAASGLTM